MPPKTTPTATPAAKPQPAMKVFGNYFMPEMRTLCVLLDLNEIPYSTENIDIFNDAGRKDYFSLNPGEQIPTIIKGFQTIIADPPHLYKYICKTENIDEKFYPTKELNKDKKKIID